MGWSKTLHFSTFVVYFLYDPIWYISNHPREYHCDSPPTAQVLRPQWQWPHHHLLLCQPANIPGVRVRRLEYKQTLANTNQCHSDGGKTVVIWMANKITYYLQWTWPKWVVSYRLWRFVLPWYIYKNRVSVSGWSPIGCKGFYTLHKFEHSMSTPYYFSVLLILSVTHIYIYRYIHTYTPFNWSY